MPYIGANLGSSPNTPITIPSFSLSTRSSNDSHNGLSSQSYKYNVKRYKTLTIESLTFETNNYSNNSLSISGIDAQGTTTSLGSWSNNRTSGGQRTYTVNNISIDIRNYEEITFSSSMNSAGTSWSSQTITNLVIS